MLKRQLYIQLFSNLIIPVLGFWVWKWSLYFILLFYILDIISSEIVNYLKIRKIKSVQSSVNVPTKTYRNVSFLFLILIIAEINIGMVLYQPTLNFKHEIWNFLAYKEMGIPQGFVLIPLVAMMAYTSYKVEFLSLGLFRVMQEKPTWKEHLKERFLLVSFCAILTLIASGYQLPEWIVLTVILVVTSGYNYLQGIERIKFLSSPK